MSSPPRSAVVDEEAGLRFPLSAFQRGSMTESAAMDGDGIAGPRYYAEFECAKLALPKLGAAWDELIDRHNMLRAVAEADGEGLILPEAPPFEIGMTDLGSVNVTKRESRLAAIRGRMLQRTYDPYQWPQFDFRVSRLPSNRYRLHFSFDLLMIDAARVEQLLGELGELYRDPDPVRIRPEPDFRGYAIAQKALETSERQRRAHAYWEARMPELAERPALPTPAVAKKGAPEGFVRRSGILAREEWERLQKSAGRLRVTPTVLLAAAFGEVVGKWCNQRHFTLNLTTLRRTPVRHHRETPVGNFATTTLLAMNLDGADFAAHAKGLMARWKQDARQRGHDGAWVLEAMRKKHLLPDDSGMPVAFTSLLAPRAKGGPKSWSTAWLGERVYGISQRPQVWLDHQVAERDGALFFSWDVLEEKFPAGLMDEMFAVYTEFLGRLASGEMSATTLARPLPSLAQRARRARYNDTAESRVSGLLHAGFFSASQQKPGQIAIDDPERRMSYGELAGYANAVARRLHQAGIRKGDLVAVVMEKGWEQIASVLGILRAGGAYLPIDPTLPKARLDYLLSNGRVSIVLTQPRLREALTWPAGIKIWTLEGEGDAATVYDGPGPDPDSLAYVIYTSGSTGMPKGVMISHEAALNTIVDLNRRLGISSSDRVLAVSSLTFDLSVYDIFGILGEGGTVVLPAPDRSRDPSHWLERMNAGGVTIWNSAPALMQMLFTVFEGSKESLPSTLRWTLLSGDWIPLELPGRLRRLAPKCRLLSLGGATEVSIWSIAYPVEEVDPAWTSIPYGYPLANQTIHVLDDRFELCPEWTAGEIFIGGDGLALGYWADEAKTAERFVRSPLTGELLYRTGDFGRFHPDGFVEFLGRKDTQIKIRGHRIEVAEVETSLLRLRRVREAAVVAVPGLAGNKSNGMLVGCVVLDDAASVAGCEANPTEDEFRAGLAALLPSFMVPCRVVVMDKMPLSANGKVDRGALLESIPSQLGGQDPGHEDEMSDFLEKAIRSLWQEILPGVRIGRHDRFSDLGGDSLSALQMIAKVETIVGRKIGPRPLLEGGTIMHIAAAARETGPVGPPPLMTCTQAGTTKPPFFFAHGDYLLGGLYCQRIVRRLDPDQPFYAIAPHGTFGGEVPDGFEEIATGFVKMIRAVQPVGPYQLGGFCNGALAMYQAAQQLIEAGETVAVLVLLDPPDLYVYLTRRKIIQFGRLIGLPESRGRSTYHRIAEIIDVWESHGTIGFVADLARRLLTWGQRSFTGLFKSEPVSSNPDVNARYYELLADYEPREYPASEPVWVIVRNGEKQRSPRQVKYWRGFIPEASVEVVQGTHLEMESSMAEIAGIIKTALRKAAWSRKKDETPKRKFTNTGSNLRLVRSGATGMGPDQTL